MPLEFCPDCENMLYVLEDIDATTGGTGVNYKCRKCP